MKCPNCQTQDPDCAEFCRVRGQSLKTEVVFPHCPIWLSKDYMTRV